MCGIVGYIGKRSVLPILIDGLKRLEYRGYDSAGIAFQNGSGIEIYKTKGKINDLVSILPKPVPDVNTGIGHTRWATHGEPSTRNAHPHYAGGVTVVHNGIIENYRELRSNLLSKGYQFYSDTDTEVIPQMISMYLKKGLHLREAIKETASRLSGTFAIGIMSEHNPNTLFVVRKGSPLVIGIGDREFFFASDIPAILPYTRRFIFMEDGHICKLTVDKLELESFDFGEMLSVEDRVVEVDWTPSMAEKGGYDYFMLKEIHEQPQAVMNTMREWIDDPVRILDELGLTTDITVNRLHIVACGTSYHAGLIGRYIIQQLAGIPVYVEIASEYRYMEPIIDNGMVFMSITQSGETADTLAAQRDAKKKGARTISICNVVGSTSAREADAVLYTRAGPEIGVASTKAFSAQLAAIYLFAIALALRKGRLTIEDINNFKSQLIEIPSHMENVLGMDSEIRKLAKSLTSSKDFLYLGRGINYPVALEGALKLKEISYIHAEGYPAGEMKHGPIALIEDGLPVVVLAPADNLYEKILSNIEEVKARGGRIIAVTDNPASLKDKVGDIIRVPPVTPLLTPFVNVIPLQLVAYHIAVTRGCDVDQPRNLAKSVTVE